MHLPWTQIANEVLDHAAVELAAKLDWGVSDPDMAEDLALSGLVRFFRWARERCPNDRPPSASAVISGPHAARLIARQFRFRGDPETLISACEAVSPSPVLARVEGGIRINGLDRYDSAWRKNYKEAAEAWDRKVAEAAPAGPSPRFPGGNRTGTGRKARGFGPPDTDADTDADTDQPPPPPAPVRLAAAVGDVDPLWTQMQDRRAAHDPPRPREARPPKGFSEWAQEARSAGHADEQLLEGYSRHFLGDPTIRAKGHPTSVWIHPEVWSIRIPPPLARPVPEERWSVEGPRPASDPRAKVAWAGLLGDVSGLGKLYALQWLERMVPVALEGALLTLAVPDRFFRDWTVDTYGGFVAHLAAEREFQVQLVVAAGPAPPGGWRGVEGAVLTPELAAAGGA